jgi:class 3 adenylate cyclase/CheY-like chemotaxis protein
MKHTLFVVDDTQFNIDLIEATLSDTYLVLGSLDGESAIRAIEQQQPDLILLDIMMPGMDGYEVCKRLKSNIKTRDIPVIFLTARSDVDNETRGFDLGAVDFISKPLSIPILMARIKTHLSFHTAVRQLEELNQTLEKRVSDGVAKIERLDQLRRFFSPAVVDLLLTDKADEYLRARRREIVVVFLDLRGYTAFTETHGPDAVMRALNEFHIAMGKIIMAYDGTVERFTGDGMMIFFNDPIEIANPAERAVNMAIDMQTQMNLIDDEWQQRGHDMKMGIGITQGYATLGAIGFEGRRDYTAIGSVVNLAARLCGQAAGGEILCDEVVESHIHDQISALEIPELTLKGYAQPVKAYKITDRVIKPSLNS